ncbi:JmjC domain-containing protein [Piscinibacter sakaiensis]|uniref:JmjC domain-containing protein n=1 Tax=Piscinibacter sakaiensis TaxID=1547922 RepID=UPI003AB080CC
MPSSFPSISPNLSSTLLGGLSPQQFMRRHWQKNPLLVRQAVPEIVAPVDRAELFTLAARNDVESRLVRHGESGWQLRQGPLPRTALPPSKQPGWTLLVQGLDLYLPSAHELLSRFRFVPDARLDDLMVSYASDGGGVGPHVDSYDVFLLQVQGRRRWRIGRVTDPQLVDGLPLKILRNFVAEQEWLLEPGDMLYLPPGWAHDGVAVGGDCMTCSIGFRAATRDEFAREVLQRSLDAAADAESAAASPLFSDRGRPAAQSPAQIPLEMQEFAADAVTRLIGDSRALACSLGEWLSEPKPQVWFDEASPLAPKCGVRLDIRTRMLWDDWHVFINGESFRAAGKDARLMRRLADQRVLSAADRDRLGPQAAALLEEWAVAGWLHAEPD